MIEAGLSVVTALVCSSSRPTIGPSARSSPTSASGRGRRLPLRGDGAASEMFNRLYISMVEAGEAAGVLDTVLDRVATQIEKEQKIKRRVKGAMIYPIVVLSFATLVLAGMLMFLVPVFVEGLRLAGRRPADAHAVRGQRVERPAQLLVHHLPARSEPRSRLQAVEEDRDRPRGLGSLQAAHARARSARSSARWRWHAGRARSRRSSRRAWTS